MRNIPPPEWLLARLTTPDRAAAILGDLTEISATRGRLWFWTAYARTIISLGWRTPAAFLFGYFAFELMMWLVPMWIRHTPPAWSSTSLNFARMDPLVDAVTVPLWFALPYGLVRYGMRDRFVRISCVAFGVATVVFAYPPAPSVTAATVIALAGAALVSPVWRRPAFVLISTVAASAV